MEYTVTFTKQIIKDSVYLWWKTVVGWHTVLIGIILLGLSVYLYTEGNDSWYIGALGSISLLGILIFVTSYIYKLRQSLQFLSNDNSVKYNFAQDYFSTEAHTGRSEIKWSLIKKVLKRQDIWLLFLSGGQYLTLPVDELSDEGKAFILSRVSETGGKVV